MQSSAQEADLPVLVISPDPRVHGGVSVFAEMMKAHLKHCRVSAFWVGSVQDRAEHPLLLLKRILVAPFAVVRKVRQERIRVVHINPSFTNQSLVRDGLIILALRFVGFKRMLVYFHGWDLEVERHIRRTQIASRALVWLLNGAAHIMVLAPEFRDSLIQMGVAAERITFTRTMFDGDSIRAVEVPMPTRRQILYMSRFEREKGVYELVDAFARIAARFPDTDLVMAGGAGLENDRLRAHVATLRLDDRITFPGYVQGEEKIRILKGCTLFALPTYFGEGMPIALLEAMGAGKALLTAKAGSIGHIIHDPENGVVLDRVTTDSVEAGLVRLLSDPAAREETGRRNETYGWSRFEAEVVTREIEALYRQIAEGA